MSNARVRNANATVSQTLHRVPVASFTVHLLRFRRVLPEQKKPTAPWEGGRALRWLNVAGKALLLSRPMCATMTNHEAVLFV